MRRPNGLNCGAHAYSVSCPDCSRILQWYANGGAPALRPGSHHTADEQEHADLVVAVLTGQRVEVIAEWCASILRHNAGPWATFTGPQTVMTARFLDLVGGAQEATGADMAAA